MAGKGGRTAAVVGWCLLLLSLTAPAAQGALSMTVSYPQKTEGNFSHVNLTCGKGSLGDPLTTATFARDDSGVYSDIMEGSDDVVSMVDIDGATVEFVFNQSQEGAFSCESDGIRSPDKILAGIYIASSDSTSKLLRTEACLLLAIYVHAVAVEPLSLYEVTPELRTPL